MRFRSTIVYFAIALALALLYLYDTYSERKSREAQESASKLFDVSSVDMDSLALITREGTSIELRKRETPKGNRWWVVKPVAYPANALAVQTLTDTLASLRSLRTITAHPKGPNPFGLHEPQLIVRFSAGGASGSLDVGDLLPTEDGYYVRTADAEPVHIISDLDKNKLDKDLNQLRRKRLFTISLDDATRFVVSQGAESLRLVAENDRWRLEDDPALPVNSQKVNSILLRFARAEAASFVDEPSSKVTSYGLTPPAVTVELSDGTITERLLLGKPVANGNDRYAKIEGIDQVLTVYKDLLDGLPASREDLKSANEEKSGNR
jgi:hypothetical protein